MAVKDQSIYSLLSKYEKRRQSKSVIGIVFVFLIIIALIFELYVNTKSFENALTDNTRTYNFNYSKRLSMSVNDYLDSYLAQLSDLTVSMSNISSERLNEGYFSRKLMTMGAEELFVIDDSRNLKYGFVNDSRVLSWVQQNTAIMNKVLTSPLKNIGMLFSVPVTLDSNPCVAVMVVSEEDIMSFITLNSESKSYGSAIINKRGEVVISNHPLIDDEILSERIQQDLKLDVLDLRRVSSSNQLLNTYDDSENANTVTVCTSLGISDLVLLTIGPESMLQNETDDFIHTYNILISCIIITLIALVIMIVSMNSRNLEMVEKLAYKDELTKGLNNTAFLIKAAHAIEEHDDYYMIYINIKRFRTINTQYGIEKGNEWIVQFYNILMTQCKSYEYVTHSDNAHFYILLRGKNDEMIEARLKRVCDLVLSHEYLMEHCTSVAMDIGAYSIQNVDEDLLMVQDKAQIASRHSGEVSNHVQFYDSSLKAKLRKEDELIEHFQQALIDEEFQVYLQPKINASNEKLGGAEALVRWKHPTYGLVYPDSFIPLLEGTNNIGALDLYVFEKVCQLLRKWMDLNIPCIPISINLSRVQIKRDDLSPLEKYFAIKEKYKIPDGLLEVESTESVMFEKNDLELAKEFIRIMHEHGILVSLDDFGKGYSSLSMLKDLNVDAIKLDRSFFLDENEKTWRIVKTFIYLAHELNMSVVAEGIEQVNQILRLRKYDCNLIQGYVYSKPITINEFEIFAQKYR